jgi:hypothetical protein
MRIQAWLTGRLTPEESYEMKTMEAAQGAGFIIFSSLWLYWPY